jgi:excinuclease ABC subunit C
MRDEEGKKTKGYAIKPERLYVEWQDEPLPLDSSDALTHQLQRIRDEVHSLVINFHRDKRTRRHLSSVLDSVPGVGPERRKRLLKEYGGLQKIALASPSEVAKVGRMSISIAERVISLLRKPY